jgi:hypothetical protein
MEDIHKNIVNKLLLFRRNSIWGTNKKSFTFNPIIDLNYIFIAKILYYSAKDSRLHSTMEYSLFFITLNHLTLNKVPYSLNPYCYMLLDEQSFVYKKLIDKYAVLFLRKSTRVTNLLLIDDFIYKTVNLKTFLELEFFYSEMERYPINALKKLLKLRRDREVLLKNERFMGIVAKKLTPSKYKNFLLYLGNIN